MRAPVWLLPAEILLLVGSLQLVPTALAASASVNIGLQASFNSAPYLVELLYVFLFDVICEADHFVEKRQQKKTTSYISGFLIA